MIPEGKAQIFADNAPELGALGLAVIPCAGETGKIPLIKGFNAWERRPGNKSIRRFSESNPKANIGALCGLSEIIVLDIDDREEVSRVINCLGDSPLKIRTHRGMHLWFKNVPGVSSLDLRKFKINAEIKAGASHVMLPPSLHHKGGAYELDGCDWSEIKDIPPFPLEKLNALISRAGEALGGSRSTFVGAVPQGKRGLTLNDRLCRQAAHCDSYDDLEDIAFQENELCVPPLPEYEVIQRTHTVWSDVEAQKIKPWIGRPSTVKTTANQIRDFLRRGGTDSSFVLLQYLMTQHRARVLRGDTFAVMPKAMFESKCLPGWTARKIHYHLQKLIALGEIVKVCGRSKTNGKWLPSLYSFPKG